MPIRVPWEDQYALAYATTAIETDDAATAAVFDATSEGIGGTGKCGIVLDDRPNINAGVDSSIVEKTTGLSQPSKLAAVQGDEFYITSQIPTVSIGAMGLTGEKAEVFLWSLFQKGATETPVTFEVVFIPYVQGQSEPEVFLAFSRSIGDPASASGFGQSIFGAICTSFGISGSLGERFIMSAELMGRTYRSDYVHTLSVFDDEDVADMLFHQWTWTIAGSAASVQAFDLTVINNAVSSMYASIKPTGYTLHRLNASGSISFAMSTATVGDNIQIENWIAGTDVLIVGTSAAAGGPDLIVTINARYTGPEVDPAEVELLLNLPYEGIYDQTNHAIQFDTDIGIDRSIPI